MPTAYLSQFEIGATQNAMTNIEALTNPLLPPTQIFKPFRGVVELASGNRLGVGSPVCEWIWASITDAQREELRSFCAGESADVFIQTPTNENYTEWRVFSCKMHWPAEELSDTGSKLDFRLSFTNMVDVTPA